MNEPLNFIHLDCNFVSVPSTRVSVSASEVIHTPAPLCLFYGLFYLCTYTSLKVKPNCPFPSFCLLLKSYLILTLMSNLNPDQQGKKNIKMAQVNILPQKIFFIWGGGNFLPLVFPTPSTFIFQYTYIMLGGPLDHILVQHSSNHCIVFYSFLFSL